MLANGADKESFVRAIVDLAQERNYEVTFSEVDELIQQQAANRSGNREIDPTKNAIEQYRGIAAVEKDYQRTAPW